MADLSKIRIPNGTEYNLKDAQARADITALNGSLGAFRSVVSGGIHGNIVLNYALTGTGTFVADTDSEIIKYHVTEGDVLHLSLSADNAGTYQWQNSEAIPTKPSSSAIIGTPVTGEVDEVVVVPSGATYLMVSQFKDNVTNVIESASAKVNGIGDLSDLKTTNDSDIVSAVNEVFLGTTDITNDLSFITGFSIQEDGTFIDNDYGRYTKDIKVREGDICTIILKNTTTSKQNVRFFGYDESDALVGQLLLVSMSSKAQNTARIVIPSEVAYVKVSVSITVNILSFIVKRGEVKSSNCISVGSPHVYLSEQIEDEILDSTTCDDVYVLYDSMCSNHPETFVRLPDIGVEASANLPIRMYRMKWTNPVMVSEEASWDVADNIYTDVYDDYRKILVTSGTHGNEKSSVYGVALAVQEILDSDKEFAKYIRANFVIDIIPIVNPSGYNATTRNNANNININRDFLTRSTPEAQAVYNVLTNGDYYACIDSHNSGGNANYIGITETNPWRNSFISIGMKFGQMMYNDWKTITADDQYAIQPYMQFWLNESNGMLQDLFTELGQLGYLIETVGVFKSGIGILTPNHKKYCKFTKDMLINSIIVLGSNNFSS